MGSGSQSRPLKSILKSASSFDRIGNKSFARSDTFCAPADEGRPFDWKADSRTRLANNRRRHSTVRFNDKVSLSSGWPSAVDELEGEGERERGGKREEGEEGAEGAEREEARASTKVEPNAQAE